MKGGLPAVTTLVLTPNAIAAVVDAGESLDQLAGPSPSQVDGVWVTRRGDICFAFHNRDSLSSRRIILSLPNGDPVLPASLSGQEAPILERLLSFCQLAHTASVRLPIGWGQYKSDDLIAFFVCGRDRLAHAPRWIAQVRGDDSDVCLWHVTDSNHQKVLESYHPPQGVYERVVSVWPGAFSEAQSAFTQEGVLLHHSAELDLSESSFTSVTQDLTYSGWLKRITNEQRTFIMQDPDHSIKLRGPAGSGKTLTLEMKAVREVSRARDKGEFIRVLFVTHSWMLATEVDENIRRLSDWGRLDEITVFPLLAIAQELLPSERGSSGLELIGEDSLSDKAAQLAEIEELISQFLEGDWMTFRDQVSAQLLERLDGRDPREIRAFAWDCLIEFGCVLGADGIFPGVNAERQYLRLPRAQWMMPLENDADKRLVLHLYSMYYRHLISIGRLSSDQLINDFINYLETFAWNVRREDAGYDLIFVDEFHLFNTQERQLLHFLARTTSEYPKIFMALDPRQSPWEVYAGLRDAQPLSYPGRQEDGMGAVSEVDLSTVHRFSPQILEFVKHLNWEFPNLDLGSEWDIDFANVSSTAESASKPRITLAGTSHAELIEIYKRLVDIRENGASGFVAIAVIDQDEFHTYRSLIRDIENGLKMRVTCIESRQDIEMLHYRRRGVVLGPAEYLAGLQFDTVLIVGLPEWVPGVANQAYKKRRFLSLLYLAVTRAARTVEIFLSDDRGGIPEPLEHAIDHNVVELCRGAEV